MKEREKSGLAITGDETKISFSLLNAWMPSAVQFTNSGSDFLIILVSGTVMVA